jgi:hypothetical protein
MNNFFFISHERNTRWQCQILMRRWDNFIKRILWRKLTAPTRWDLWHLFNTISYYACFFLTIILCMLYHFEVVSYTNTLVWQKKFYKICRFSFLWMIKICIGISWLLTWLIITYVCWIRCPVKIETGQDKKMSWKWYLLFIPFI